MIPGGHIKFAPHHELRQFFQGSLRGRKLRYLFSIPKHRNIVGYRKDLVQPVGDEQKGNSLFRQTAHGGEKTIRLGLREHRRGLVQHKKLHVFLIQLPGDLHELHVPHGKPRHGKHFVYPHVETVQRSPGILAHGGHVEFLQSFTEHAACQGFGSYFSIELDILGNTESGKKHELLVYHADAEIHGMLGRLNDHGLSVKEKLSPKTTGIVNHRHTEQNVHKGGFSGTVFSHQGVDFSGPHRKVDPLEHPVAKILLYHVAHFKATIRQRSIPPLEKTPGPPQKGRPWVLYNIST